MTINIYNMVYFTQYAKQFQNLPVISEKLRN